MVYQTSNGPKEPKPPEPPGNSCAISGHSTIYPLPYEDFRKAMGRLNPISSPGGIIALSGFTKAEP